ncbi:MAG: hypothetical protein U5R14_00085 [Gemmatimonadota bacterium]|nr:hypothetical protein [Gemmatimonadota bacterium]
MRHRGPWIDRLATILAVIVIVGLVVRRTGLDDGLRALADGGGWKWMLSLLILACLGTFVWRLRVGRTDDDRSG